MKNYNSSDDILSLRVETLMNNIKLMSSLNHIPEDIQVEIVSRNSSYIRFIKNPCEAAQEKCIASQDVSLLGFIQYPTEKVIQQGIDLNAFSAILSIKNPSESIKRKVVEKDPYLLEMIKNPSDEIQLYSLREIWTKYWYKHVILVQFTRNDEQWFQKEVNKLKLTKGPLRGFG